MAENKRLKLSSGLSLSEAKFADLVASGLNQSEAYERAFSPADPSNRQSISVSASRVVRRPQVAQRIEELRKYEASPSGDPASCNRDQRLLNGDWLKLEVLSGLYELATSGAQERTRLDALGKLALAVGLISQHGGGTTVNVQQNAGLPSGNTPDSVRAQLVSTLKGLLPAYQGETIDVSD